MVGAFDHQQLHLLRVDAHNAKQLTVEHLAFAAGHGDQHAVDFQTGARADVGLHAGHHRAFEFAVLRPQGPHREAPLQGWVARLAREGGHGLAQSQLQAGPHPGLVGHAGDVWVVQQTQRHLTGPAPTCALLQQGMQHAGGVAVPACARVVLRVGHDHGGRRQLGRGQGLRHGLGGRQHIGAPLAGFGHALKQALHHHLSLRAVAPDHGAAFGKVRRRKAHAKTEHATGLRLQRDHLVVQVLGRVHPGALRIE